MRAAPHAPAPTEAELREVFDEHCGSHVEIVAIYALRTLLGAAVESLLVCDRALYLAEQLPPGACVKVHTLFDPRLSPRNFAVCAVRPGREGLR